MNEIPPRYNSKWADQETIFATNGQFDYYIDGTSIGVRWGGDWDFYEGTPNNLKKYKPADYKSEHIRAKAVGLLMGLIHDDVPI